MASAGPQGDEAGRWLSSGGAQSSADVSIPPLGSDRAGFGKPGGGALGHSLRASSAARRGLLAPPRPAASPGLKYPGDY